MSQTTNPTGNIADQLEIPTSVRFQTYDPETFDLIKPEVRFGKLNAIILHDPRLTENE